jgi:hypothetical protein
VSATDHLGEQMKKLYHGSPHWFAEGDTVNPTHGDKPVAYASNDRNDAALFGIAKANRGPFGTQLPLFVPVYEVSSPDAKTTKGGGLFKSSKTGFRVDKLHGYVRAAGDDEQSTKMKDRWL